MLACFVLCFASGCKQRCGGPAPSNGVSAAEWCGERLASLCLLPPLLQLGVRYTITTLNKLPPPALLTDEHFQEKVGLCVPSVCALEGRGVWEKAGLWGAGDVVVEFLLPVPPDGAAGLAAGGGALPGAVERQRCWGCGGAPPTPGTGGALIMGWQLAQPLPIALCAPPCCAPGVAAVPA